MPFTRTISRQQHVVLDLGAAAPAFDTNLICVNADQVPLGWALTELRTKGVDDEVIAEVLVEEIDE